MPVIRQLEAVCGVYASQPCLLQLPPTAAVVAQPIAVPGRAHWQTQFADMLLKSTDKHQMHTPRQSHKANVALLRHVHNSELVL